MEGLLKSRPTGILGYCLERHSRIVQKTLLVHYLGEKGLVCRRVTDQECRPLKA